jgi:hypothetical protein
MPGVTAPAAGPHFVGTSISPMVSETRLYRYSRQRQANQPLPMKRGNGHSLIQQAVPRRSDGDECASRLGACDEVHHTRMPSSDGSTAWNNARFRPASGEDSICPCSP